RGERRPPVYRRSMNVLRRQRRPRAYPSPRRHRAAEDGLSSNIVGTGKRLLGRLRLPATNGGAQAFNRLLNALSVGAREQPGVGGSVQALHRFCLHGVDQFLTCASRLERIHSAPPISPIDTVDGSSWQNLGPVPRTNRRSLPPFAVWRVPPRG